MSDTVLALKSSPEVKTGIHWFMLIVGAECCRLLPVKPVVGFFLFHGLNDVTTLQFIMALAMTGKLIEAIWIVMHTCFECYLLQKK